MRNAIRNILTNWRNIFGKQLASSVFPYVMVVESNPFSFTAYNGYGHGALDVKITGTFGGTETSTITTAHTEGGSVGASGLTPDIGSTLTIDIVSGVCVALEVNGVFIFDNR